MPDFVLGMDAVAYYGPEDTVIGSLTELTNVRDVTPSLSASEADVTTRANAGWRGTAAALRDAEISFEMVWKTTDAGFTAIKDAFIATAAADRVLAMAFMDGLVSGGGVQGIFGNFSVTGFEQTQGLEDAIIVSVTVKLLSLVSGTDSAWAEVA